MTDSTGITSTWEQSLVVMDVGQYDIILGWESLDMAKPDIDRPNKS